MIIKVPFYYAIKGVPRGARNERDFAIRDEVDIEVVELNAAEAPAVAVLPAGWREGFAMKHDSMEPRAIRHDGIGFLRETEMTHYAREEGTRHILPMRTAELAQEGRDLAGLLHLFNTKNWQYERSVPLDSLVLRHEPNLSDRDATVAGIAKSAARYVIVEGILHERCHEPVMRLNYGSHFRGNDYPNWFDVAFDFAPADDYRGHLLQTWNLPEFLEDRDYWCERYGDERPAEVSDLDKVEILDASVFRYDPTKHLAVRALQVACQSAEKCLAQSRSIEFVGDYFAAQDLFDALTPGKGATDVEAIVEAMRNLSRHERGGSAIVDPWSSAWARPLLGMLDRRAALAGVKIEPALAAPTI